MNLTGPLVRVRQDTHLGKDGSPTIGTSRPDMLESTAGDILKNLGSETQWCVSGPQGLDEAGLDGEPACLENGQVTLSSFQPEDIGMSARN